MNNPNEADSRLKWRQSHEAIKKNEKKKLHSKTHRTVKWSRFGRLRLVKIQKVLLVEKKKGFIKSKHRHFRYAFLTFQANRGDFQLIANNLLWKNKSFVIKQKKNIWKPIKMETDYYNGEKWSSFGNQHKAIDGWKCVETVNDMELSVWSFAMDLLQRSSRLRF